MEAGARRRRRRRPPRPAARSAAAPAGPRLSARRPFPLSYTRCSAPAGWL